MYGQIHIVVRELVLDKFGQEMWDTILTASEFDEEKHFLVFSKYDDTETFKLVGAVSQCLNLPMSTVLEVFGDYFLVFVLRHGYDKMLRTLGKDVWNFIQNLDSLHSLLTLSYKNITPPSFRCETGEDGGLLLHYYTVRPGIYPMVLGLIRAVGRDIFQQTVDIEILDTTTEDFGGKLQEHTVFKVKVQDGLQQSTEVCKQRRISPVGAEGTRTVPDIPICPMMADASSFQDEIGCLESDVKIGSPNKTNVSKSKRHIPTCPLKAAPVSLQLSPDFFCSTFPYHIIFDRNMIIKQCGHQIQKLSPQISISDTDINQVFRIVHPNTTLSIENIRKFINSVFFIAVHKTDGVTEGKDVTLKGQMIWLKEHNHMMFIGSPRITSLTELSEMNVFMSDIPLYDVTRELVLLHEQRGAEIDIANKLDETTAELKKTSKALESEKKKTDMLLYQMLPQKVAHQLKNGQQVEAEKFEQVTILFSDIVTFTNISAACSPLDIVNMLNNLYQRFDQKTDEHGVYKVETIGDAYMVVCGVPEKTTDHAGPVAKFAIDMILAAGQVNSPHTGKPIQVRVGVHTGPAVAGVVGLKMPRYCLFGDTVNTASRMESHGLPGRIHISPSSYQALKHSDFIFKRRGEITVKGKGKMATYFLVGDAMVNIKEPIDDYSHYPVINTDDQEESLHVKQKVRIDKRKNKSRTCNLS